MEHTCLMVFLDEIDREIARSRVENKMSEAAKIRNKICILIAARRH